MSKKIMNMVALLAIAGAESFPVLAEGDQATTSGFLLQEEHLAAIEANNNTLAARITELEGQLATANASLSSINDANETIVSLEAQLATAKQENEALKKKVPTSTEPPKEGKETPPGEGPKGKEKYLQGNRERGWIK